jgi:hypothetical protein
MDFTVVFSVRQRFGDRADSSSSGQDEGETGIEMSAPFVGAEKTYSFNCPNVAPEQFGVLLYQSLGVSSPGTMEVNGRAVLGDIPTSFDLSIRRINNNDGPDETRTTRRAQWNGNIMLLEPGMLRTENTLRIASTGGTDDFVIDNVVVFFKTSNRPGRVGDLPLDPGFG